MTKSEQPQSKICLIWSPFCFVHKGNLKWFCTNEKLNVVVELDLKWPYDIAKVGYLIQKFQNQQMTKISHLVSINHEKNRLELVSSERWSITSIYIRNLFFLFTLEGVNASSNLVDQIFSHITNVQTRCYVIVLWFNNANL